MCKTMSVDIETYSGTEIKAGVRPYSEDKDFTILLIAYQLDGEPTKLIDLGFPDDQTHPAPDVLLGSMEEFTRYLFDPTVTKTAYNASFERTCLARFFDRAMPPEEWDCTMVLALSLGLPGSLSAVGAALGLDKQKLEAGKELIRFFCRPYKNGRRLPEDHPEKWATFCRYNVRDVDVEVDIRARLIKYPRLRIERDAWAMDQRINDRGVRLDMPLVQAALQLDAVTTERLKAEAKALTGLQNPKSDKQLKGWLAEQGVVTQSLDKEALPLLLESAPNETVRRVLELRQLLGKTSVKKYEAMERACTEDGRAHNLLQFGGASRTGRWAGRLIQVQNLPQNKVEDLDLARNLVRDGQFELLELAFGSAPFILSQLIRTAFIPSPGNRFIICDYSAIEARVLAWLAGEKWVLEEFYGEGLIYEATASMMFGVPKNDIKKGGCRADLRSKGKVATLACGYQGGAGALIKMGALKAGIPEAELAGIVKRWRGANKKIVKFWYDVEAAALRAYKGEPVQLAHGIRFSRDTDYLFITLPSGRRLAYYKPEICPEAGFNKMGLTYMGLDSSKRFGRQKTYGGKLVENITQATARDCLRDAMLALEAAGYHIVFTVHDEVVLDAPKGTGSLEEVSEIMDRPLAWAPGLPLKVAGFEAEYYQKD